MNCVDSFWNETALNAWTCLNVSRFWGGMGLVDQGPVQWGPSWTSLNMLRGVLYRGGPVTSTETPCEQTDRQTHAWKHYLPNFFFRGRKNIGVQFPYYLSTRMHSHKMCTARSSSSRSSSPWVWAWRPPSSQTPNLPLDVGLETPPARPTNLPPGPGPGDPPVNRILDTRFWKYYLPNFVAGGNDIKRRKRMITERLAGWG